MLLPRFTIRTGLMVLTAGAMLAWACRSAFYGVPWGIGVTVAAVGVVLLFLIHAVLFGLAMLFANLLPVEEEVPGVATEQAMEGDPES